MDAVNIYLHQYDLVMQSINDISSILHSTDNISKLDVTDSVRAVVDIFKGMMTIERYGLPKRYIEMFNSKNDEIKNALVKLKNDQIYAYNLKVWEVNDKIDVIKKTSLALGIGDISEELSTLKWSNVYLYGDWKKNNYVTSLDYEKLQEMHDKVSEIGRSINIQNNEPIDLRLRINFCEQLLEDMKNSLKDNMSLSDVNVMLDKCVFLFGNVIETDALTRKYVEKRSITKESIKNYKIAGLYLKLTTLKKVLIDRKNKLGTKTSEFSLLKIRLEILNKEVKVFQNIISDYYGKSNKDIIGRFNSRLKNLNEDLNMIEKMTGNAKLDSNQIDRLNLEIKNIRITLGEIKIKLKSPNMLLNNFDSRTNDAIKQLDEKLNDLKKEVERLESPLNEDLVREQIRSVINDRKVEIQGIEKSLIGCTDTDLIDNFNVVKDNFNNICKVFNGKCPLFVKKVKSSYNLYDEYKKESLQISGLASISLMERSALIPAIMHGNMMLETKIPVLKNFVNSVNTILGSVINARRDKDGVWYLSNGFKIDSSVAGTSLLQNLSVCNLSPKSLIVKIRNFVKKMELKIGGNTFVNKSLSEIRRVKLFYEKNKLEKEYYNSGLKIDEFCERYNLSDYERGLLEASVAYYEASENKNRGRLH